ncbi:hypothetical protein MJO28_010237 [Puccinia striiformis f. sp. tritici]|uniref:Uncharacterized protein n=1 Tax=Puccinia striiformis f. sp. tritici TaxID=168172 RepID=A0ACC0E4C2_9BASI|nr:hypothetical protein MJO28_010237 [Puccinia striiformis f. sp. tritici]
MADENPPFDAYAPHHRKADLTDYLWRNYRTVCVPNGLKLQQLRDFADGIIRGPQNLNRTDLVHEDDNADDDDDQDPPPPPITQSRTRRVNFRAAAREQPGNNEPAPPPQPARLNVRRPATEPTPRPLNARRARAAPSDEPAVHRAVDRSSIARNVPLVNQPVIKPPVVRRTQQLVAEPPPVRRSRTPAGNAPLFNLARGSRAGQNAATHHVQPAARNPFDPTPEAPRQERSRERSDVSTGRSHSAVSTSSPNHQPSTQNRQASVHFTDAVMGRASSHPTASGQHISPAEHSNQDHRRLDRSLPLPSNPQRKLPADDRPCDTQPLVRVPKGKTVEVYVEELASSIDLQSASDDQIDQLDSDSGCEEIQRIACKSVSESEEDVQTTSSHHHHLNGSHDKRPIRSFPSSDQRQRSSHPPQPSSQVLKQDHVIRLGTQHNLQPTRQHQNPVDTANPSGTHQTSRTRGHPQPFVNPPNTFQRRSSLHAQQRSVTVQPSPASHNISSLIQCNNSEQQNLHLLKHFPPNQNTNNQISHRHFPSNQNIKNPSHRHAPGNQVNYLRPTIADKARVATRHRFVHAYSASTPLINVADQSSSCDEEDTFLTAYSCMEHEQAQIIHSLLPSAYENSWHPVTDAINDQTAIDEAFAEQTALLYPPQQWLSLTEQLPQLTAWVAVYYSSTEPQQALDDKASPGHDAASLTDKSSMMALIGTMVSMHRDTLSYLAKSSRNPTIPPDFFTKDNSSRTATPTISITAPSSITTPLSQPANRPSLFKTSPFVPTTLGTSLTASFGGPAHLSTPKAIPLTGDDSSKKFFPLAPTDDRPIASMSHRAHPYGVTRNVNPSSSQPNGEAPLDCNDVQARMSANPLSLEFAGFDFIKKSDAPPNTAAPAQAGPESPNCNQKTMPHSTSEPKLKITTKAETRASEENTALSVHLPVVDQAGSIQIPPSKKPVSHNKLLNQEDQHSETKKDISDSTIVDCESNKPVHVHVVKSDGSTTDDTTRRPLQEHSSSIGTVDSEKTTTDELARSRLQNIAKEKEKIKINRRNDKTEKPNFNKQDLASALADSIVD